MVSVKNEKLLFIIIVFIGSLSQITADLYLPSLPAIFHGLNTSVHAVQLSISVYMLGFALSLLVYGPISDGIGRHKPLLVGISICLLGGIICASAQTIVALIIGRLIQGLGAGALKVVPSSMLRDLFSGNKLVKYMSYTAIIGVGFLATGPLLGGYIQHYLGWRANFWFLVLCALLALLAVIFIFPETNKHLHPENLRIRTIKRNTMTLITNPIFIGYSFVSLLTFGALLAWLTAGPIVLQNILGLTPVGFGWAYTLTGIAFAIGAFINSRYVSHFGIESMLQLGLLGILIAGLLMLVLKFLGFTNVFVIVGPAMVLLFGASLVFPNTSAGIFQPFPKIAGTLASLFYTMRVLGGAIASSILALSHDVNQIPMAIAFIVTALAAWVIFYFSVIRKKTSQID